MYISASPAGHIFVEFYIGDICENLSRTSKLVKIGAASHEDLGTFILLTAV